MKQKILLKNEPLNKDTSPQDKPGQVTMEFTFGIIAVVLLTLGLIKVFTWTGEDLVGRRIMHESILTEPIAKNSVEPLKQVRPYFFSSAKLNAAVESNIFGEETP